ncbi:MAG: DUF2442 domain-containing protein [Ekhidna sp.]|nr:DUF2442 domain-containing protein [Ekhidna sp.]
MNKITKISISEPYKLLCFFNNGEQRILDLEKVLDPEKKFVSKVLTVNTFKKVRIDSFGGISWEGVAEMKDLDGKIIPCDYDICPDFAYLNSTPI